MSNFTDWGETWVCDYIRGAASALPQSFHVGLLSSVSDDSYTEVSWTGYERVSIARSLTNFSGTQGNGTTTVSSGKTRTTVNNVEINFGTAGGSAAISAVGLFVGENLFTYSVMTVPLTVGEGDTVKLDPYSLVFTLGSTGGCTDWLSNKLIDHIWRGETYVYPATMYLALYVASPSNNTRGTEVNGGGYSRVAVSNSVWSTPTDGTITLQGNLMYPPPTGNWGNIVANGFLDSRTGGNLLWWAPVTSPKTIVSGGAAPRFDSGSITMQVL